MREDQCPGMSGIFGGWKAGEPRRHIAVKLLWVGPGELLLLDLMKNGRIHAITLLVGVAAVVALGRAGVVECFAVRATADVIARVAFLPAHSWWAFLLSLDVLLICGIALWRRRREGMIMRRTG